MRTALSRRVTPAATLTLLLALGAGCSAAPGAAQSGSTATSIPRAASTATTARPAPSTIPRASTTTVPPATASAPTSTAPATTLATTTTLEPVAFDPARFDAVVRAATVDRGDPAVGVAVVHRGTLVHQAAYGIENPATGAPATPASRFRLASISKVLTATVVMQLVEEGALALDEPVLAPLTAALGTRPADPRMDSVTLRHLLSHTSGFDPAQHLYFGNDASSCAEAARSSLARPLATAPGARFRYSNTNYCLLGLLVEQVTRLPYEWAVSARLLQPLGISDMRVAGTVDVRPGDVSHHTGAGRRYLEPLAAAGAWIGTPADVALILSSLDAPGTAWRPLDGASTAAMRTPITVMPPDDEWTYGLGLRLWSDGSWGHTGTVEHTRAVVVANAEGWVAAAMVSGERPPSDDLRTVVAYALAAATG